MLEPMLGRAWEKALFDLDAAERVQGAREDQMEKSIQAQQETVAAIIAALKAAAERPELVVGLWDAVCAAYLQDESLPRFAIPHMGEREDRDTTILVGVLMGATLA